MADNWSGVVINDYEAILPVCWRKKFGVRYSYDVPFIQQLGWFGEIENINEKELLRILHGYCRYGDYAFNYENQVDITHTVLSSNCILSLDRTYDELRKNYKNDLLNNLKRANKLNLLYGQSTYENAIETYRKCYGEHLPHVRENDYYHFGQLCGYLEKINMVFVKQVADESSGQLLSTGLFLRDERRIYNLMNATTEEGRVAEANHFLLDNVLRDFAGSNLIFDFEGSDIPGIRSFYEKFGAINQPYQKLHFNNLPFPLRILKR
jgi:hypothetical protein